MSRLRFTAFLGSVLATTVVLALALGPAFSAIPHSTNKKYYACFSKKTGAVKLINYPKVSKCRKGWKLRTWNAKGNQGPAGPAGAQGSRGPSGSSNWGDIVNKPAGFADGVDNVGYASATQATVYNILGSGATLLVYADTPVGTDVELTIIPAAGKALKIVEEWWQRGPDPSAPALAAGMLRHWYKLANAASPTTFKVRTRVYNTGIALAALKKTAKKVRVGVTKKGPGAKKGKKKRR